MSTGIVQTKCRLDFFLRYFDIEQTSRYTVLIEQGEAAELSF